MLRDDLGRRVPAYTPLERAVSRQARTDFPDKEFQRIRRALAPGRGLPPVMVVLLGVGVAVMGAVYIAVGVFGGMARFAQVGVCLLGGGALMWSVCRWGFGSPDTRLLRREMLAAGRCPSCAYPLDESAADSGGIATCPECSAAWRLTPSAREPVNPPTSDGP